MKVLLTNLLLFAASFLFAQEKGVTPVSSNSQPATGQTRAVVVGISDYQNEEIPDLRFADKDAEAFAKYLQSPGGGNVSDENIRLLTNSDATMAAVASELDWLVEESTEGDKAIIYFSGHGDVEAKTARQPGFLLTYDSPPKIYIAGAYPLFYLQLIIETLSSDKNVQTLVITDACRAGKLAGSEIGGTQATASNLAKQYANEIKILSCQPDEFSLEGEQWGGGRGAFSYHLIEGMIGLADKNENGNVNLLELENYLETIVPEETDPQSQIPMTVGSKGTKVAFVDAGVLAKLKDLKANQLPTLAAIESRGMEETVLAKADSSIQKLYDEFLAALENENLLDSEVGKPSADDLYRKLMAEESLESLHRFMTRKLATALQDDAQQAINAYLLANPAELEKRWKGDSTYYQYPRYLGRAAELLGESHYMHKYLTAKQLYFEGLNLRMAAGKSPNRDSMYHLAMQKQRSALELENRAAYFYNELGVLHTQLKLDLKAFEYYEKAIELAPEWALPYANYAVSFYYNGEIDKAIEYGEKAGSLSGDFPQIYSFLAWIYANNWSWKDKQNWKRTGTELQDSYNYELSQTDNPAELQKRLGKSIELLQKAVALDSTGANAYYNLGFLYEQIGKPKEAISAYKKVTELDSLNAKVFGSIAANYNILGKFHEAEKYFSKAINLDSTADYLYNNLGLVYGDLGKTDKAILTFKKAMRLRPRWQNYNNLGYQHARKNLLQEAELYHLKGILFNSQNTHPSQIYWFGDIYRENLKRYDVAADMYQLALEIKPNFVDALKKLADVQIKLGRDEELKSVIQQIEKLAAENFYLYFDLAEVYLKMEQKEKAFEIIQNQVLKNADDPDVLNTTAWNYQYHYGEYAEAENLFKKALELKGDTTTSYAGLGYTYLRDGKPEKSWEYFQKMYERDSLNAERIYNISAYFAILGKNDLAIYWLEKTLKCWNADLLHKMQFDKDFKKLKETPEYQALTRKYFPEVFTGGGQFNLIEKEAYYLENCVLLARVYEHKKLWEKALAMYQKAIELKTENLSNAEKLALAEAYLKLGEFEKAQAIRLKEIDSDDAEDFFAAGSLFYHLHDIERAEIYLDKFLETSNKKGKIQQIQGFCFYNSEEKLVKKYVKKGLELNPKDYSNYFGLAFLHFYAGDLPKAIQVIDETMEKFPNQFNLQVAKALFIAYSDDPAETRKAFKDLEIFYPGITKVADCLELMNQKNIKDATVARAEIHKKYAGSLVPPILDIGYVRMLAATKKHDAAMDIIEKDGNGFFSYQFLQNDSALAPLRKTERFKAFMQSQFPGKGH